MSNTKEYILVPKGEFEEMVEKFLYMLAGEAGGVDNWNFWGYAINDFIEEYNQSNGTNFDYMSEIAEDYANAYDIITKEEE